MTFLPFTRDELDRLEQLNQARTQGEWITFVNPAYLATSLEGKPTIALLRDADYVTGGNLSQRANGEFIAALANQASRLLAISRQHAETVAENERLRDALRQIEDAPIADQGAGSAWPVFVKELKAMARVALAAARPPDTQKEGT